MPHPTGGYDDVHTRGSGRNSASSISYTRGDDLHRLDGPAYLRPNSNPKYADYPEHEEWMVDGRHHRLDGPAMILRKPGLKEVETESFYVYGNSVPASVLSEVRDAVAAGAPVEWVIAYAEGLET